VAGAHPVRRDDLPSQRGAPGEQVHVRVAVRPSRRFPCFSMSASSAAVRTSSSDAPGWTWDWPAFAFSSSARNSLDTVMWIRLDVAVIGSTSVLSTSVRGMPSSPGRISGTVCFGSSTGSTGRAASTRVTTVLVGTSARGFNSAASSRASCLDRP
jgi:hypothetical protein